MKKNFLVLCCLFLVGVMTGCGSIVETKEKNITFATVEETIALKDSADMNAAATDRKIADETKKAAEQKMREAMLKEEKAEAMMKEAQEKKAEAEKLMAEAEKKMIEAEEKMAEIEAYSAEEEQKMKCYELTLQTDVTIPSHLSAEELDVLLEGTPCYGLGYAYKQAEEEYGVNSLYLIGLAIIESGAGSSEMAQYKNNLFGYCAYDSDTGAAITYSSFEESIMSIAQHLRDDYLTPGACYFMGYTIPDIDVYYCTSTTHAQRIVEIIQGRLERLGA